MSQNNKTKKTVKVIVDVLLILFLAFSLCTTIIALSTTSNGDGIPNIGGYGLLTVESDSMEPTIKTGDLIVVKMMSDKEKNNIKKGDIITFEDEDKNNGTNVPFLNTHRVEKVVKNKNGVLEYCVTWGDNRKTCPTPDKTQRTAGVLRGNYTGVRLAGFGTVVKFLCTQVGFGLCILLPLVLFFLYEIVNFVRTIINVKNRDKKIISKEEEELIKQQAVEEYLRQQSVIKEETKTEVTQDKE